MSDLQPSSFQIFPRPVRNKGSIAQGKLILLAREWLSEALSKTGFGKIKKREKLF